MGVNFVKADSRNLPKVDAIMFFKNNPDFYSAELRNVKTAMLHENLMVTMLLGTCNYVVDQDFAHSTERSAPSTKYIYMLKVPDETLQLLDEHLLATQQLGFSPVQAAFELRIQEWDDKLRLTQKVLDEWIESRVPVETIKRFAIGEFSPNAQVEARNAAYILLRHTYSYIF